jgi:molybdenum-dependent DNA-binding transcriptional regulator ModE
MVTSKKDYLREVEKALQKWADQLEELTVKAKSAKPERQHELQSLINAIVENKNFIEMRMKEIKKSDDNWLNLRESVEGAAKNLDESYRSALAYIM